jgi:hypothetical protein
MYVCMYVSVCVHVCMRVCVYVCVYVCMYIYIYIYTYIYVHICRYLRETRSRSLLKGGRFSGMPLLSVIYVCACARKCIYACTRINTRTHTEIK